MSNRKMFKLSLIAAACMAVSVPVFSGQIVGVPQAAPSGANGFGALNLENVEVKIISVEDGTDTGKVFNESDGSYAPLMTYGDTFVSEIFDDSSIKTGVLHGKDWPVGEPSGVKVVNSTLGDTLSHYRPASCLLSTSYFAYSELPDSDVNNGLEGGWLDSETLYGTAPNPTLCDSPFQTHKRFKVDAITPTDADVGADSAAVSKPIDLVINVDATSGEVDVRRYMILQKLNNYSDKRFTGYNVEVGFGVGANFKTVAEVDAETLAADSGATIFVNNGTVKNLTVSIGTGEDLSDPENPKDIWDADDLATFSAGLFGTADDKHPNDGFFDTRRAGYYAELDATETKVNSTVAFASNYNTIFGDWLPSKWEPTGIFFDDDKNPLTDASLVAFWGEDTDGSYKWLKGHADSFAPATLDELYYWSNDTGMPDGSSQYAIGSIEDVLNLGVTYIVNVGDVTTYPTANFTLRMTPVTTDVIDDEIPGWIANPAIAPADILPADYVPTEPVDEVIDTPTTTTPTSSSGGSASMMDNAGLIATLIAFLGLGGWLVRRKMSK